MSTKCRVRLDCSNARTDLNLCLFILARSVQTEQTAICRFIEAFAIIIVPHRNSSFEAVKFYLNTKCRYSDPKYMYMFIVKTKQYNGNIVNKTVKDTRLE